MPSPKKRKALGKGLAALFQESGAADAGTSSTYDDPDTGSEGGPPQYLPTGAMLPNPDQPRSNFDEGALKGLAASIADSGIVQPILVRPAGGGMYEIVAGERRWRAAQIAGAKRIPVVVRDLDDTQTLQCALVENLQRVDLNAIEEARGYAQLQDSLGCSQDALAKRVGKSRPQVANSMRLLKLPDEVLKMVETGQLSAGHVRPLIEHPQARTLARQIRSEGMSARQAEDLAAKTAKGGGQKKRKQQERERDPDIASIEESLSAAVGALVRIYDRGGTGSIRIHYDSLEEFDRINGLLSSFR